MRRTSAVLLLGAAQLVHAESLPTLPPLPAAVAPASLPALHPLPRVRNGAFDLRFVNVGQVVDLVYGEALHVPHVISSDVLEDTRVVSFQFDSSKGDLREFVKAFLDSQGFEVQTRNGVDFVSKKTVSSSAPDRDTYVYQPRHRSAAYLSKLIEPLFTGRVSSVATPSLLPVPSVASPASGVSAAMPVQSAPAQSPVVSAADQLVFAGTAREVKEVRALLPQLDTPAGEVVVRGWAYEVDDTDDSNTGFSVASQLLGVGVKLGSGSAAADTNALQFDSGRLDFAISAMQANSRFHEMSSPNVRCVSGQQVKLNVGQQVPTVASVSFQGTSGTPVQSIDYQDAGVIFNVTPTVMDNVIELNIDEEISSFVNTTTGVNGSPTKNTRSLQTVADLQDGEVIVLGGLVQDQSTVATSGERFLPAFLDGHTKSKARTEVVLVLQVQKI
ncbi:type II secretion system protein GspD [Paraburkholderia sp. SOS3]|uniref:type II secretion system protein GspD n=1 Tax=Paraburkholderia sp. SOS3 TaxID=1926494 RepID=UPI00094780CA|nr:type II secretory pathway protein [Paraburkholderia sp. SOS3]APR39375.1 type II secretory pathway protein [Paraburkholderia sp. SOS3]